MSKSVLRKSNDNLHIQRNVSFSPSVKVYGYLLRHEHSDESDESDESTEDGLVSFVELKDNNTLLFSFEVENDGTEEPEDFLVHKVVYDSDEEVTSEDNTDSRTSDITTNETIVYYPTQSETEVQEFVVHCVNQLGERRKQDSAPNDNRLCELSVENIKQHNKLTEGAIQVDTEMGQKVNTTVDLSPPLQDLGIYNLIFPKADDWFWNLDISPLNSVQESDSGSNISSEDTMIMMTSEESKRNEKRIQESLHKFETLKKSKADGDPEESTGLEIPSFPFNLLSLSDLTEDRQGKCLESSDGVSTVLQLPAGPCNKDQSIPQDIDAINGIGVGNLKACIKDNQSNATIESKHGDDVHSNKTIPLLNESFSSLEIPEDVRDWKIDQNEPKSVCDIQHHVPEVGHSLKCNNLEHNNNRQPIGFPMDLKPDELEIASFVNQCTERIERIKKRYGNKDSLCTPRRGIRPRFGSSVQILQQNESNSPPDLPNHYSWPCYSLTSDDSNQSYVSDSSSSICDLPSQALKTEQETIIPDLLVPCGTSLHKHSQEKVVGNAQRPMWTLVENAPSKVSGVSSPNVSTESLCKTKNQREHETASPDGMIYYSMRV